MLAEKGSSVSHGCCWQFVSSPPQPCARVSQSEGFFGLVGGQADTPRGVLPVTAISLHAFALWSSLRSLLAVERGVE